MRGWLSMPAVEASLMLAELQRQFMTPGPVCEIGVWEGRYLTLLSFLPAEPQPCSASIRSSTAATATPSCGGFAATSRATRGSPNW
jgi:hypothetical protein